MRTPHPNDTPAAVIMVYFFGNVRKDSVGFIVCEPEWDGEGWAAGRKIQGFDSPEDAELFAQILSDGKPIPLVIGGETEEAVSEGVKAFEFAIDQNRLHFDPTEGVEQ